MPAARRLNQLIANIASVIIPLIRKIFIPFICTCVFIYSAAAQATRFSLLSDAALQRSFSKTQRYWAIGQTIAANFHFTPQHSAYAWVSYYTKANVNDQVTATAKTSGTIPEQFSFNNRARFGVTQMSVGWKYYLKGRFDAEEKWNLYSLLGFGLLFGSVDNTQNTSVDTSLYNIPVSPGEAHFKRLTYDVGLGVEQPMGGDIFAYSELKAFIPSSGYPSDHLLNNDNTPMTGYFTLGLRILF